VKGIRYYILIVGAKLIVAISAFVWSIGLIKIDR
jgi:hypothetical protein